MYSDTQPISKLSVRNGGFLRRNYPHERKSANKLSRRAHLASLPLFLLQVFVGRPSLPFRFHPSATDSFHAKISTNVLVYNHFSVAGGFRCPVYSFPRYKIFAQGGSPKTSGSFRDEGNGKKPKSPRSTLYKCSLILDINVVFPAISATGDHIIFKDL